MMPPLLSSLGPITDWLSSRRIGAFTAKYDEVSQASSAAKVCYRTSRDITAVIADALSRCTARLLTSTLRSYRRARRKIVMQPHATAAHCTLM